MKKYILAPSLLAADFAHLAQEIQKIENIQLSFFENSNINTNNIKYLLKK